MPESLAVLFKYPMGRSKTQNPRECIRISTDGFRQFSGRLRRFAERVCHIKLSKDMNCAGKAITSRDLP